MFEQCAGSTDASKAALGTAYGAEPGMDDAEHSERKSSDGGTSDHEALVDVPLSFELSGFEPLPAANRGASASA